MARGRKGKKKKKGRAQNDSLPRSPGNFVKSAGPGCYIVRWDDQSSLLWWEQDIAAEDYDVEEVPDIALDPDSGTLTVCNVDDCTKVAIVTVFEATCLGADREVLDAGHSVDEDGAVSSCVTFIILSPPQSFAHLCYIDCDDLLAVRIESDVQKWSRHPSPDDCHQRLLGFPLRCEEEGPFLCTQGEGGTLTHFFSGNLHAVDFRCDVGTPLVAVGHGTVIESNDANKLSGIAVSNLFKWNSILLQLDDENDPLFVEYVHIQSSLVKKGDNVRKGDVIGYSGNVGFCPEPHLHFAAYRSAKAEATTVRVRFYSPDNGSFLPVAGVWYNEEGPIVETIRYSQHCNTGTDTPMRYAPQLRHASPSV